MYPQTHTHTHAHIHRHTATHLNHFHAQFVCALFFNMLLHNAAHYSALQHTTYCNTLQRTATHYNALQHITAHCNTLQRTATHYSALQHTASAKHCKTQHHTWMISMRSFRGHSFSTKKSSVFWIFPIFSLVLALDAWCSSPSYMSMCSVLQCVAVCCRVLQCVAVCCSVLQCVVARPAICQYVHIIHVNYSCQYPYILYT